MNATSCWSLKLAIAAVILCPSWTAAEEPVHVEYSIRTPIPRRNLKLAPSGKEGK